MTTITRAVTVAAGVFAPGHLGELTQYLPFELVDDVLAQTRTVRRRLRVLPSRVGVCFVLALGMYPRLGYARVWAKLTAGLAGLDVPCPSEKALRDLRRRLGPAPVKALFEVVAGPLAQPGPPGVRFGGLRTVAVDGCNSVKAPDTGRNRWWLGRIRYRVGFAGYPALRLMALAETGTRGLPGAALGSAADRDEATVARRLLPCCGPGCSCCQSGPWTRTRSWARSRPPGRCWWRGPGRPATRPCWATCRTAPTCRTWAGWQCGSSRPG
jgi:Insertion element 4 transposase N-terminal